MIHLINAYSQVIIAIQSSNFRCEIEVSAALRKQRMSQDPGNYSLFVFINLNRMMVRVLSYDGSKLWLTTKWLSKGRFQHRPRHHQDNVTAIAAKQLKSLPAEQPSLTSKRHDKLPIFLLKFSI